MLFLLGLLDSSSDKHKLFATKILGLIFKKANKDLRQGLKESLDSIADPIDKMKELINRRIDAPTN